MVALLFLKLVWMKLVALLLLRHIISMTGVGEDEDISTFFMVRHSHIRFSKNWTEKGREGNPWRLFLIWGGRGVGV